VFTQLKRKKKGVIKGTRSLTLHWPQAGECACTSANMS
jgi:hypothetical protein